MADAVEVAVESALLNRLVALTFSPALPLALPEVAFDQPIPGVGVAWLKADFLPAPTVELGIDYGSTNQHQGIFQVSVFYHRGEGELKIRRVAAAILQWFKRGTIVSKDGFRVEVTRTPYLGALITNDPWTMLPVTIRYLAFAPNPA